MAVTTQADEAVTMSATFQMVEANANPAQTYRVTFATEDQAITYLEARRSTWAQYEDEANPIPEAWARLTDLMYPTCEHGLSADLCYGPAHYASDEEIAQGW